MQLSLFAEDITSRKDKSGFSDPNFASNKTKPVHRWVPWIAGFSGEFVQGVLDENLSCRGVVLDPFSGVGTTLVEAAFSNHDVVGFEINPYAALACRVKLNARILDAEVLRASIKYFRDFCNHALSSGYEPNSKPPQGFKTRIPFFSPRVLRKVLIIKDFISNIESNEIDEVFQIVFASTMVIYSNYSYEPSLTTRKAVGKNDVEDFPVIERVLENLREIISDIEILNSSSSLLASQARIVNDSFFDCEKYLEAESVDLCITSPPYLNNYHYIRNTRPQLYWLGFVEKPNDTEFIEQENFGKYWQTVRELGEIKLDFPDPPPELVEQLALLRSLKVEKGIYGGSGWANYAASYFNDCYRFTKKLNYVLKKNRKAFVVIGNSILQGVMIPTDKYLGDIAERAGLQLVDIHVPRPTRVGNSIIQSEVRVEKAQDKHQLYESVVQLIKN